MAEARDRLIRPVDVAAAFVSRRQRILGVLADDVGEMGPTLSQSPTTQQRTPGTTLGRGSARGVASGTQRTVLARVRVLGQPATSASATRVRGRRLSGRTPLPAWYPRTPLRDITAITTAMEQRRTRLSGTQDRGNRPAETHGQRAQQQSHATLKQEASTLTPPIQKMLHHSKAWNLLLLNDNEDCLTPQRKLLDQIETLKEEVFEELKKIKKTPRCKRAEREKKLRVLRSMR